MVVTKDFRSCCIFCNISCTTCKCIQRLKFCFHDGEEQGAVDAGRVHGEKRLGDNTVGTDVSRHLETIQLQQKYEENEWMMKNDA